MNISLAERDSLVLAHMRLAAALARSVATSLPTLDLDDGVSVAYMSLVRAANTYAPVRGPFWCYAKTAIRNNLCQLVRDNVRSAVFANAALVLCDLTPEEQVVEAEMSRIRDCALRDALAHLPPELKQACTGYASGNMLRYARERGVSVQTMHDRFKRARKRLRAEMTVAVAA